MSSDHSHSFHSAHGAGAGHDHASHDHGDHHHGGHDHGDHDHGGHDHDDHGHEHGHRHSHDHVSAPRAQGRDSHDDHRGHAHGHSHAGHGHHHAPANFDRAFAIGISVNIAFVAIEAFYGWRVNSLALLADAGHNLGDVAGLVLAWAGSLAGKKRPDERHTYGWKRASILAAFTNAVLLLVAMGSLAWEAVGRLHTPEPTQGYTVMVVAGIGIFVNFGTAMLFMRGGEDDINIRGAYLHLAGDALVSAGVVVVGGLALWTGWAWLDPVASLLIALIIVASTWSLFRQSLHMMFDGVPEHIDLIAVRSLLESLPGVQGVHDLHVWATGTTDVALTAHLVMPAGRADDAFLEAATHALRDRFEIGHVTIQVVAKPFMELCGGAGKSEFAPAAPQLHHGHSH